MDFGRNQKASKQVSQERRIRRREFLETGLFLVKAGYLVLVLAAITMTMEDYRGAPELGICWFSQVACLEKKSANEYEEANAVLQVYNHDLTE